MIEYTVLVIIFMTEKIPNENINDHIEKISKEISSLFVEGQEGILVV